MEKRTLLIALLVIPVGITIARSELKPKEQRDTYLGTQSTNNDNKPEAEANTHEDEACLGTQCTKIKQNDTPQRESGTALKLMRGIY